MKKLYPPPNSPTVYYQKEWMSVTDYNGYSGNRDNFRRVLNRVDFIFTNDTLFKGSEKIIIITATRYEDSIWLSDWRCVELEGTKNSNQEIEKRIKTISVPLESSAYIIGEVNDFKVLTYRVLRVIYSHSHNFRTLSDYKKQR